MSAAVALDAGPALDPSTWDLAGEIFALCLAEKPPTKTELLRVCAWCKPQRIIGADGKATRPVTDHDKKHTRLTHGICSACAEALEQDEGGPR